MLLPHLNRDPQAKRLGPIDSEELARIAAEAASKPPTVVVGVCVALGNFIKSSPTLHRAFAQS